MITHKTNIADAFGKEFGDVREGEARSGSQAWRFGAAVARLRACSLPKTDRAGRHLA